GRLLTASLNGASSIHAYAATMNAISAERRSRIVAGLIASALGAFILLASAGVIPLQPDSAQAPAWVIALCGVCFACAGGSITFGAMTGAVAPDGALSNAAPKPLRAVFYFLALAVLASLALVGSWVAFGDGPRTFTTSFGGAETQGDDLTGRVVF